MLQKWIGAMNARPSAQATFSCWASTSFGIWLRISAAISDGDLPRSARVASQRCSAARRSPVRQLAPAGVPSAPSRSVSSRS